MKFNFENNTYIVYEYSKIIDKCDHDNIVRENNDLLYPCECCYDCDAAWWFSHFEDYGYVTDGYMLKTCVFFD